MAIVTTNLVMHLDAAGYSGSGDWLDSVGSNNAALNGGITWSSAEGGKFTLSGTAQYFTVPDVAGMRVGSGEFSLEYWLKFSNVSKGFQAIGSKGHATLDNGYAWICYLQADNTLNFLIGSGGGVWTLLMFSGTIPNASEWIHLVVSRTAGNTFTIYLNGSPIARSVVAATAPDYGQPTYIGWYTPWGANTGRTFQGDIAVVREYVGHGLTEAEVLQNWTTDRARFGQSPRFYLDTTSYGRVPGIPAQSILGSNGVEGYGYYDVDNAWALPDSARIIQYHRPKDFLPHIPLVKAKPLSTDPRRVLYKAMSWYDPVASSRTFVADLMWQVFSPAAISPLLLDGSMDTITPGDWLYSGSGNVPWSWSGLYMRTSDGTNQYHQGPLISIFPAIGYVYRPSTKTVLGVAWNALVNRDAALDTQIPYYLYVGQNYVRHRQGSCAQAGTTTRFKTYSPITGVQAGDYLIVEWWAFSKEGLGDYWNLPSRLLPQIPESHMAMIVSGGGIDLQSGTGITSPNVNALAQNWNTFVQPTTDPSISIGGEAPPILPDGSGTAPTLTNVDPTTGPRVRLTFDGEVIAGGDATTIGPAADGVGVTSVTQVDTVTVDLNLAVRPSHPLGEAEAQLPAVAPASPIVRYW